MKLVVDTNVIMSALIKNSTTRALLLNPQHRFYLPEFAIDEIKSHNDLIISKSGLKAREIGQIFDLLATNLEIVAIETIAPRLEEAKLAMKEIDESDAPFLALSMSIDCEGIWSNDEHFKKQKLVRVWNTTELVRKRN